MLQLFESFKFDDYWLTQEKSAVMQAAAASMPRPDATNDELIKLSWEVAQPLIVHRPIFGSPIIQPVNASSIPDYVPGPRPEPRWVIRVRFPFEDPNGQTAKLLATRPDGAKPSGGYPKGVIADGEVIVTVPDESPKGTIAVEPIMRLIQIGIRYLEPTFNCHFFPTNIIREFWKTRPIENERQRQDAEAIREKYRAAGHRVA